MLAVSALFAAVFAGSAMAQTPTGKIGWIITDAFANEKEGITRIVNANKTIETEMRPRATELEGIRNRLKTISDDIQKMQSNPAVPVNPTALAAKQEEGEKLQRDFEYKQKDAQAALQKRNGELLGPIYKQLGDALNEYAKQKGYTVILDVSAMTPENGPSPILVLDASANITKDFITFFNARPATTASAATPKP